MAKIISIVQINSINFVNILLNGIRLKNFDLNNFNEMSVK